MKFPCVIIEHPHQTCGRAWIADDEVAIIDQLANCRYGDNWSYKEFESLSQFIGTFGDETEDWPEDLQQRNLSEGDFPAVLLCSSSGEELQPVGSAESELDFALDYIGHDLNSLTILESAEEARDYLSGKTTAPHQPALAEVRECAEILSWTMVEDDEDA